MGDQEHNTALPHNTAKKEMEREREMADEKVIDSAIWF